MDLLLLKDFFELLDLEKSTHVNVTTYSTHLVKVLCIGYWKKKKKKKEWRVLWPFEAICSV